MNLTLPIPDDLAAHLGSGDDMARRALEAFGVAEYRANRLSAAELLRLLGFDTRLKLDEFLKTHGVFEMATLHDIQRERQDLERLGF